MVRLLLLFALSTARNAAAEMVKSRLATQTTRPAFEQALAGMRRRLQSEVSCGGHSASTCEECPEGNGAGWCNGDCIWRDDTCVSAADDEGEEEDGDTSYSYSYGDDDLVATTSQPTPRPHPNDICVDDLTTTGANGGDCSTYYSEDDFFSYCGYFDDDDFTASLQCCACGGYLGKTLAPTMSAAPTAVPSTAVPTTPAPTAVPSTAAPTTSPYPTCMNDDSTTDKDGSTCSSSYDKYPSNCGRNDDYDFTASLQQCINHQSPGASRDLHAIDDASAPDSLIDLRTGLQCCACGGFLGKTLAPTISAAPTATPCVNDESTIDSVGRTCLGLYEHAPEVCGMYDDEDFTASLQCCACGGHLGKTFAPTATPPPSTWAPSATPAPSPAPTTTPAPSVNCLCNRTLVVIVNTGNYPTGTTWSLTMGEAPDRFNNCVDGSAAGGPYSDADTYTQEITICEDVTYTFKIECCWHTGYFYLELDGTRFRENEPGKVIIPRLSLHRSSPRFSLPASLPSTVSRTIRPWPTKLYSSPPSLGCATWRKPQYP